MASWKPTDIDPEYGTHLCPKCKRRTEMLIGVRQEDDDDQLYEYRDAERCKYCGWTIRFDQDD